MVVGQILRPHGIKGAVRLRSFMENPPDIFKYDCTDADGKIWALKLLFPDKGEYVCQLDGLNDRTQAEKMKGCLLSIEKTQLPILNNNEYYQADLIGFKVQTEQGNPLGTLIAFHNYGAGDLIELSDSKDLIPFHKPYLININRDEKYIIVELPVYV